ncbi:hypothetical protein H0H87_003610 [Tephrocybe sp. NHM501043]|nr:hypothetical protein H0H87_003610 [Tephrocybe sp. NHM501043]
MRAVSNTSPNRNRVSRSSNPYRRTIYSPSLVSPVRAASLSPRNTPSPKRKGRSSASASIFTSFVRALKIKPKGKKPVPKLGSPISINSTTAMSLKRDGYNKQGLQRVRSVPAAANWNLYTPQRPVQRRVSSPGDDMDINGDQDASPVQVLSYDPQEDPFATPPRTPVTPLLSKGLNSVGTPDNSPESARSRKRRAVERSRLKTLQLLGPDACMAVRDRFGDAKRAWEV